MTDFDNRDYITAKFETVEGKIEALSILVRRELTLLSEDRERQRDDLSCRLEGMNALRAQLDRQAATFVTRERFEAGESAINTRMSMLEKTTWRGLGILAGLLLVIQVMVSVLKP